MVYQLPSEDQMPEMYLALMQAREELEKMVVTFKEMGATSFEDLSRSKYAEFQRKALLGAELFDAMGPLFTHTVKIIENPALKAHIEAVVNAED